MLDMPQAPATALARDEVGDAFRAFDALRREIVPNAREVALTPARRKKLAACLRQIGGVAGWDTVLAKIRGSKFLRGDRPGGRLIATIDWISNAPNALKTLEGNYDDRTGSNGQFDRYSPPSAIDSLSIAIAASGLAGPH